MSAYQYDECGLDNVVIHGVERIEDDNGGAVVEIPAVNLLHTTIAIGVVSHPNAMSPRELRFLRTEIGMTQSQLAEVTRVDKQTVGRWERGETPLKETAEVIVRELVKQRMKQRLDEYEREYDIPVAHLLKDLQVGIDELSKRVTRIAQTQPIEINLVGGANYQLRAA